MHHAHSCSAGVTAQLSGTNNGASEPTRECCDLVVPLPPPPLAVAPRLGHVERLILQQRGRQALAFGPSVIARSMARGIRSTGRIQPTMYGSGARAAKAAATAATAGSSSAASCAGEGMAGLPAPDP